MTVARACVALAAAMLPALGPAPATAQDWPTRTIKIVVGFSAGGGTDLAARMELSKHIASEVAKWQSVREKAGIPQL